MPTTTTTTPHDFTLEPLPFSTLGVTRLALYSESEVDEREIARAASELLGRLVEVEFVDATLDAVIYHAFSIQ